MSFQFLPTDTAKAVALLPNDGGSFTFAGKVDLSVTTGTSSTIELNCNAPSSLALTATATSGGSGGPSTTTVNCPSLVIVSAQIAEGVLNFTGQKLVIEDWMHVIGAQWQIQAANNAFSESVVDAILNAMDALLPTGSVACVGCVISLAGSNAAPGATAAIGNLVARGITVITS